MHTVKYDAYWQRKKLLSGPVPHFAVRRWWPAEDRLCDIERVIFDSIAHAATLLDFGAGDLRVIRKLRDAGFLGQYDTLDISPEFQYTYRSLDEVNRRYEAILLLDVLEHLPLEEGLELLNSLSAMLEPGGVLIVQTPNARGVPSPMAWDMTHLHCYSAPDLWAHLTALSLDVSGYRVAFRPRKAGIMIAIRSKVRALVAAGLLGCDWTENIVMVAKRPRN